MRMSFDLPGAVTAQAEPDSPPHSVRGSEARQVAEPGR